MQPIAESSAAFQETCTMNRTLALVGLAAFTICSASAQTVLHYREGQRVEPEQVMRILAQPGGSEIRTRSIRLLDNEPAAATGTASASANASAATKTASTTASQAHAGTNHGSRVANGPATPSALSLPIRFGFDSTDIVPSAREQLDALAAGIKLLPPGRAVVIEGHTDASGPDEYNQALSARRALVVKRYLVQMHGIAPSRLVDTGLGKRQPIDGRNPYAGENRRVQFHGG
jgi:outer membrane protein OmpA-like peptidoglycan-associated protein